MYNLGETIKLLRQKKNITQKQLAIDTELSERGVQNYELNLRRPTYDVIIKLCQYFDVSADYLLGLSDEPTRLPHQG